MKVEGGNKAKVLRIVKKGQVFYLKEYTRMAKRNASVVLFSCGKVGEIEFFVWEKQSGVFGIKRFQLYLYGRKFTLVTDHQPLTRIFGPKSSVPPLAAARLQRWAVLLSGYDFDITFKNSAANANADFFSRFPLQSQADDEDLDPDEHYVFATVTDELPLTAAEIAEGTKTDSLLVKVYEYTSSGWPGNCPSPELRPFWNRRDELSLENGCLLWGRRVIIPLDSKNVYWKSYMSAIQGCAR